MAGIFTLRVGTLVFGNGSLATAGEHVRSLTRNPNPTALVVCGKTIAKSDILKQLLAVLEEANVGAEVYSDVEPEPSFERADVLREFIEKGSFDAVVGIGGGSSMDTAKAAAAAAGHGSVKDFMGVGKIPSRGCPMVMIPTTAGSGSEVTGSALFLDLADGGLKKGIVSPFMIPEVAIIDPETTVSCPPSVTNASGMDALVHAIEAYVSIRAHGTTDAMTLKAIELISGNIRTARYNGTDLAAREAVAIGSVLAGIGIGNAGLGMVHGIAHALGGKNSIPHGVANTVVLPYVMEFNIPASVEKYAAIAKAMGVDTSGLTPREAAELSVDAALELMRDLGMATSLQELGLPMEAAEILAEDAMTNTRHLGTNPRQPSPDEMRVVCRKIWTGM